MKSETSYERLVKMLPRLDSYPGAHPNENWELESDLRKCTLKERAKLNELGITIDDLMNAGLNRGEVHHLLFGYDATHGKTT